MPVIKKARFSVDAPAVAGALLGALLFLLIYGPSTLNPCYDSWIYNGYIGVDILQHYTGWLAFRLGDWALPLTFTNHLHWPLGGVAALADCIPLVAVPLKLLSPLLPATFQYFGWFTLLCMMAAGAAGAKLLGQFALPDSVRIMGSALFSASPVLLERAFQHTALAAQFIVILALYSYFKARRGGFEKPPVAFVALTAVAVFVHVYFVPMVLALAFATAVDAFVMRRRLNAAVVLAASVGCALLCGWMLGYFQSSEYVPGGYGNFGSNLNTFWNPDSFNWAMWDPAYQNLHWSRLLPGLPVVGDSLGNFTYLGAGVLLALVVCGAVATVRCVVHGFKNGGARPLVARAVLFAKNHAGLAFACFALGLFAVSNTVTANSRVLFTVPLPAALIRLCDIFRASGRMLWPMYYLLVLCAVLACFYLLPGSNGACSYGIIGGNAKDGVRKWLEIRMAWKVRQMEYYLSQGVSGAAPLVLLAVLVLQGFDLSGVLQEKHTYFASPVVPQSYASPENWDRIAQPGRVLYQLELNEDRPTALRAAAAGMPSNFFLLARGTPAALQQDIDSTQNALLAGKLPSRGVVYITSDAALAQQLETALGGLCESFSFERYTVFLPN